MTDFQTMRDIGRAVGMTSHQVGRRLKQLGLRTPAGKPSRAAFDQKLCAQRWAADGSGYCWAWETERVLQLLGAAAPAPTQPQDGTEGEHGRPAAGHTTTIRP